MQVEGCVRLSAGGCRNGVEMMYKCCTMHGMRCRKMCVWLSVGNRTQEGQGEHQRRIGS